MTKKKFELKTCRVIVSTRLDEVRNYSVNNKAFGYPWPTPWNQISHYYSHMASTSRKL